MGNYATLCNILQSSEEVGANKYITCDQALFFSRRCSERKNELLIQLLVESSVKSPESGLFSDWSGNKRQHKAKFPVNCDWLTLI